MTQTNSNATGSLKNMFSRRSDVLSVDIITRENSSNFTNLPRTLNERDEVVRLVFNGENSDKEGIRRVIESAVQDLRRSCGVVNVEILGNGTQTDRSDEYSYFIYL